MVTVKKKTFIKSKDKILKTRKPNFFKKEAINLGFEIAKKNIIFFIGIFAIVFVISFISSAIQIGAFLDKQSMLYILLNILTFIINAIISIGLIKISLEFIDNKKPKFLDLFYVKPLVNFILASIIRGVIASIGFILFIIPGIIFSIRLQYVTYLVIDKNLPPVESIKKSWEMTKGNTWNLFFFCILLLLINILGAILFLVGLFVTVPLTMLATAFVYRKLLHSKTA
ncbi:MAG: hypothetical protein NT094_00600 [Candidatus Staskawiczbacteria bacterium]|nr:hypothetical protein [Candidatus Staskawiczbacteria bacterium]